MILKDTDDCKEFIFNLLESNQNLKDEVLSSGLSSWVKSRWSRTEKRSIKDDTEFLWIFDPSIPEFIWLEDGRTTFVGCTVRGFLHKDADCFVSLITDEFNKLIAWTFQID